MRKLQPSRFNLDTRERLVEILGYGAILVLVLGVFFKVVFL